MKSRAAKEGEPFGRTLINDKVYGLYKRDETHLLGKNNGKPDDWWVAKEGSDDYTPWVDIFTNRPCFEVNLKEGNSFKSKWGETQINGHCKVTIKCNGVQVHEFSSSLSYGLARAKVIIGEMLNHAFNFTFPEKEIGRKVWFMDQPGIIKSLILDQGAVMIEYDGDGKFDLTAPYDTEEDRRIILDGDDSKVIKTGILDRNIWWHRNDYQIGEKEKTREPIKIENTSDDEVDASYV